MTEVRRLLQFEVLERLGAGEASTIYRVADPDEGRIHALKHVVRSTRRDTRFLEALGNEFRVGRTFLHPNLRRVYELKLTRNWAGRMVEAFLLMEYVQGQTLDADPPRSVADTIDAFLQIAHGMQAMHEMGHVHCDLKPTNVLRSRDGHLVMDCISVRPQKRPAGMGQVITRPKGLKVMLDRGNDSRSQSRLSGTSASPPPRQ